MSNLIGIDVSAAQGQIDWQQAVGSNLVNFAFCKASEGSSYKDPQFDNNWQNIKDAGLARGSYHFARTQNDPTAEADHFLSVIGELDPMDLLALDIEVSTISGPAFVQWVLTWCQRVQTQTGVTPLIYTGGPFFDSHCGNVQDDDRTALQTFPLWLAAYTIHPEKFTPNVWKDVGWKLWQSTGDVAPSGSVVLHVPGIHGNVDRDEWVGDLDSLKAFASSLHTQ